MRAEKLPRSQMNDLLSDYTYQWYAQNNGAYKEIAYNRDAMLNIFCWTFYAELDRIARENCMQIDITFSLSFRTQ